MSTIVVLTALSLEMESVLKKLNNVTDDIHPDSKTIYKIGNFTTDKGDVNIIVGRTNQTNPNAAIETERVIKYFNPDYLFFVGVAGGLKDVKIGDIVIGTDVYGYEKGKAGNQFQSRAQFGFSSYELEQMAVNFSQSEAWQRQSNNLVQSRFHDQITAYAGTLASGEKVLSSRNSDVYEYVRTQCSHALAVEMEGLGFLEACRPYSLIRSLIIRGISDLIDSKSDADSEGAQIYAANNAAVFLFGLINHSGIGHTSSNQTKEEQLFEIVTKLYPEGLKDNGIWQRAGGDLSLVQLHVTGKAQWIGALRLLENRGGGEITTDTLIREMKIDFPNNKSWASF